MITRDSALRKVRRVAVASFENAVRLHEDAVLLYKEDRIPSSMHTSVLSIEEIGKYFMHEDVCFHNRVDRKWSVSEIQEFLASSYSHIAKHQWFIGQMEFRASKPLIKLLYKGQLERIKQMAIYVGFPRRGKFADMEKRLCTPFSTSKKLAEQFITLVNDFFVELSLGVRKGVYILDIPEIDDWLATAEFERYFVELWPKMQPAIRRRVLDLRRLRDDEEM